MAKGIGLIGNFKGKIGNMVGYKLTDSNSGNTQGIRVYQPIVKNPKTAAQAEQRAKLAPINATYRALKMVIDRGNEGLPYGNKSRLAWLKNAFKADYMPWFIKGAIIDRPVICPLTKGSLTGVPFTVGEDNLWISITNATSETAVGTVGAVSTLLMGQFTFLKEGDQITLVAQCDLGNGLTFMVESFILDSTSSEATTLFTATSGKIYWEPNGYNCVGTLIVSREGANGEHLRSNSALTSLADIISDAPYDSTSKTAAIESYRSSAAVNADWAEESIQ